MMDRRRPGEAGSASRAERPVLAVRLPSPCEAAGAEGSGRFPRRIRTSGLRLANRRRGAPRSGKDNRAQSVISDVEGPIHRPSALRQKSLLLPCQRKLLETFGDDRGLLGLAAPFRSPAELIVGVSTSVRGWLRFMIPASTRPWSAFCMTSTELAKPSIEKISLCRNTFLGALLASRSVGERLTRSTRTIEPPTVISSMPSV